MLTLNEKNVSVGNFYSYGIESTIYDIKNVFWKKKEEVYKKFDGVTAVETLERKRKVLLGLMKLKSLNKYFPEIRYLVENDLGILTGYVMQKIYGIKIADEKKEIDLDAKLQTLKAFREIIDLFREYGFLFVDIRVPNLILKDNVCPMILDVDGMILMEDPIYDMIPSSLYRYLECNGKMDAKAQIYMFNLLTMHVLEKFFDSSFILDKDGQEIFDILKIPRMEAPVDTVVDHEYMYQHIKRR